MTRNYPAYRISKTALNAITLIWADELRGAGISVNSACLGWVRTYMSGPNAYRSVEQGTSGFVELPLRENDVPTGKFPRDGQEIDW